MFNGTPTRVSLVQIAGQIDTTRRHCVVKQILSVVTSNYSDDFCRSQPASKRVTQVITAKQLT